MEIVVESPVEIADKVAEKLQYYMEDAGKYFCPVVPLKAEPVIDLVWDH